MSINMEPCPIILLYINLFYVDAYKFNDFCALITKMQKRKEYLT